MTKPLTKVWRCATCNAGFKASETKQDGKFGRTCPSGHFHSYYQLGRHEQGKKINVGHGQYPRPAKVVKLNSHTFGPRIHQDKSDLLALLWISAYEKVIDQLPTSTSRLLVEGAMKQAYQATKLMLESPTQREAA